MKSFTFYRLLLLALFVILIAGPGCGRAKSVYTSVQDRVFNPLYKKAKPVNDGLKKRVLLLPIIDHAELGDVKAEELTTLLQKKFEENGQFSVHRTRDPISSSVNLGSSRIGTAIDPALAKMAEEKGMNVLVTAVLNPFETHINRWGFWPVQRIKHELEISMVVNVLDITNGTLLLSRLASRKTKLPKDKDVDADGKSERKIDKGDLDKILVRLFQDQASSVIEALKTLPWSGRVLSASPDSIIINAGKDIGLNAGSVFNVFEKGEAIRSANGRTLFLLGEKIGEIKTIKVMDHYASAVPVSGSLFRAGLVIRLKN